MKNQITLLLFFVLLNTVSISAVEPAVWSIDTRTEVLRGDAKGVSINENGTISLAPKLSEVFKTEQPYIWSSAVDQNGSVFLGTGSDGKIYRVEANGGGKLFADLNELNVSALAIGKAGEIFAATSPDGKVYRIDAGGNAAVYFEPKEKYIWSLAVTSDGSLAVGTGENGKIYKVKTANAAPESSLLFDTSETHIISLIADDKGNLYAGTDGGGLVLRFAADGKPFALLDSPLREIHSLAFGADGSIYALALSDSAGTVKTATAGATNSNTAATDSAAAATPEPAPKSRYDLTTAKSAVYRLAPDGGSEIIWNSPTVTAFSIAANANGIYLGTSDKGRIYSVTNDGRETLLLQSNEGQISTMQTRGNQIYATSSNAGKLYRFGTDLVAEGSYESSVLNAKSSAAWGRIWWRGNGNVVLQTRSGNTEKPNETWSDWSANYTDSKGGQIQSPKANFLQWRAILNNQFLPKGTSFGTGLTTGSSVSLSEVNVVYLPQNIAPEILSIQILPANVGLAANPPIVIDPNIANSGIDPTLFGLPPIAGVPPRRIFQRGARSLQWTAEDRNGDKLEYAVYYREASETNFKLLKEHLRENFYALDGLAFADGRYIFKIRVSDAPSNPAAQTLSGERISEPIDIDNTAPTVSAGAPQISGDKARLSFDANDASNYLRNAEYSINGGEWQTVYAEDGISDSGREHYTFEISLKNAGEYSVTLRVFDANGNVGNARTVVKK